MENTADSPAGASPRAPREEVPEPEAEAERTRATIAAHHFQRPVVSPVPSGVRTAPRGG